MRILLVEPDRLQARAYGMAFERSGHTMVHARTAQAAVQATDEQMPDVVVLELQMPGHNGVEFLYEFRSYPEWLQIPIILHTFVPLRELAHAAALKNELGVRRILYKPTTTLTTLCETVQSVALVGS
jgi:CheY-like chemotaxis protein